MPAGQAGAVIRMATDVPSISEVVMDSGRRCGPKTMRAGRSSRAHDEKRVMSNSAVGRPLSVSGATRRTNGTSSAW